MRNQNGFGAVVVIILLLALSIIVSTGWHMASKKSTNSSSVDKSSQATDPSTTRDSTRKEHATRLASILFSKHTIQKEVVPDNQAGLDMIQTSSTMDIILDPQTNQPYFFNENQSTMLVGEVTFKFNATCDDKIENSSGTGLIIDGSVNSIAVAIKLESGSFACESNL